jgi:hypothetical protein
MQYSSEEKTMWLEDFKGSGLSSYAYAKKNGLNYQTFKNWLKGGREQKLVEIKRKGKALEPEAMAGIGNNAHEAVIEVRGIIIRVPVAELGCSLKAVMEVVKAEVW